MSQNRPWVSFQNKPIARRVPLRLTVQKWVDGSWVTTASAGDMEAAERHARAVGGKVQCLNASGFVIAIWENK